MSQCSGCGAPAESMDEDHPTLLVCTSCNLREDVCKCLGDMRRVYHAK